MGDFDVPVIPQPAGRRAESYIVNLREIKTDIMKMIRFT